MWWEEEEEEDMKRKLWATHLETTLGTSQHDRDDS